MKRFQVEITETLRRIVEVDATDVAEAEAIARKEYQDCSIILDSDDYEKTEFCVKDDK